MGTPPLKLYRASAGSGKTFTLTVEYIILLITDPGAYKHILAVTFTNKATAEMKSRILNTLEGIRDGSGDATDYFNMIRNSTEVASLGISDEEIRRRAGVALHNLSHDYSRFHIETIDSFFISVIKDLAHELNLPANLTIDLNSDEVLSEAVDNIIDNADTDDTTFRSILDFIREKIDEEKNWKLDEEMKDFGRNIFNEKYLKDYQLITGKIEDKAFMQTYKTTLRNLRNSTFESLQAQADHFLQICSNHGLTIDDFKQKRSGVYGFFSKLATGNDLPQANSYVKKCLDDPAEWNKTNGTVQQLAQETLMPLLAKTLDMMDEARLTISTVDTISKHLNHLQLLTAISSEIDRLNQNANRFLLANSAHFLQRMIDRSSVPFIYEKCGTRFNHIMIDEFQDTSDLQWSNFLPLLNNSLDANNTCLVVGDVKQSIYRFRNSDWNILNTLDTNKELTGKVHTPPPLNMNRRSKGNIITFNNTFFEKAVSELNNDYRNNHDGADCIELLKAYSDVSQQIKKENKEMGYVSIDILSTETDDDSTYEEATLRMLAGRIDELLANGIQQRHITILLRFNRHIASISQYFADHAPHLRLISDEAYRLSSSLCLNIIMYALRHIVSPDDKLPLLSLVANTTDKEYAELLLLDTEQLTALLPERFREETDKLPYMPIKDLIETIYDMFSLKDIQGQDAYMFYFHDQLTTFLEDRRNDINSLLRHWDETLSKKTIPGNNDSDGIRIMSIHKSKGLEFHTVLIPFCDWRTTGKPSDLMWCRPTQEPYGQIPLIPVNFVKDVQNSIFRKEYDEETLRNNVDNLNLLYVAFTRAKNNLFIITSDATTKSNKNEEKPIDNIAQLIQRVVENKFPKTANQPAPPHEATDSPTPVPAIHIETGKLITESKSDKQTETEEIKFHSGSKLPEFRQSNKSKDFVASEEQVSRFSFIDRGLLYHSIMQEIDTVDDIDRTIRKMYMEGVFADEEERQTVSRDIHAAFENPIAARWFNGQWTVASERAILLPGTNNAKWKMRRPDRVIMSPTETICIDYKTGAERTGHNKQVKRYMNFLTQMGYPNVQGYVWYIIDRKIEKV